MGPASKRLPGTTNVLCVALVATVLALAARAAADASQPTKAQPMAAWAVKAGYALERHSEGFRYPTALVAVPEPGKGADAPLYFVAELGGRVLAVTRSGEVHVFAEGLVANRHDAPPTEFDGQIGLGALCLDPGHGYLFATHGRVDAQGVVRLGLTRFDAPPGQFALRPSERREIGGVLADEASAAAHQIGGCAVMDGVLYVSVGDGERAFLARDLGSPQGKILRLDLDGKPLPNSPYAAVPGAHPALYAHGFRNPFGLAMIQGQLFTTDNGQWVDRFVCVEAGHDYLWDGTDRSLLAAADFVFNPSVSPLHMGYADAGAAFLAPEDRDRIYVAITGGLTTPASPDKVSGVMSIRQDLARRGCGQGQVLATPEYVVAYRGGDAQGVTGIDVADDGIYFTPLLDEGPSGAVVYRLRLPAEDGTPHPRTLDDDLSVRQLIIRYGCTGCHVLGGSGNGYGPNLDPEHLLPRLSKRLGSEAYRAALARVDALAEPPFTEYAAARRELRQQKGDVLLRTWIRYHLMEPRFDTTQAQMPNLGIGPVDAARLADYLVPREEPRAPTAASTDASTPGSPSVDTLDRMPFGERMIHALLTNPASAFWLVVGLLLGAGASWLLVRRLRPR